MDNQKNYARIERAAARRKKALALLRVMRDEPYAGELAVYVRFFEGRLKR